MTLRKQSVACLIVAGICTLILTGYLVGPSLAQPYEVPAYATVDRTLIHDR